MKKLFLVLALGLFLFPLITNAQALTYQQLLDQNVQLQARVQTLVASNKSLSEQLAKYETYPEGCTSYFGYSITTGKRCDGLSTTPPIAPTVILTTTKQLSSDDAATVQDLKQQRLNLQSQYYKDVAAVQQQAIPLYFQQGKITTLTTELNQKLQKIDVQIQQIQLDAEKPQPLRDVCPNIDGPQVTLPSGMRLIFGECIKTGHPHTVVGPVSA